MTTLSNHTDNKQSTKDYFVAKQIKNSGYVCTVSNNVITIESEISDGDLEEMQWVYEAYEVRRK